MVVPELKSYSKDEYIEISKDPFSHLESRNSAHFSAHEPEIEEELPQNKAFPISVQHKQELMNTETFQKQYTESINHAFMNYTVDKGVYLSLTTDKQVYEPGETVLIRFYYFNLTSKEPLQYCTQEYPHIQIFGATEDQEYWIPQEWSDKC